MRGKLKWIIAAVAAVAVVIAGGILVIHLIEGPSKPKLTLNSGSENGATTSTVAVSGDINGTWAPTSASQVGYRVKETLFGQSNTAVGRTNQVSGTMTINGTTVSTVDLSVDMASVSSDRSQRDGQFRGRIMDVSSFPTATFKLTSAIKLSSMPTDNSIIDANATGELTLHGTTKSVTFPLKAQRSGANVNVNGEIPITFANYGIDNPSGGPASVGDDGTLEFLVVFAKS